MRFDKTQLANLRRSLQMEVLLSNKSGDYSATTAVGCNTRKQHGLFVAACADGGDPMVLLTACDETVVQHGAEFHLGIHRYGEDVYSPRGHKYMREMACEDGAVETIYRVGGAILRKRRVLMSDCHRLLVSYTMLESQSTTALRLMPFLAFRRASALTHQNSGARTQGRGVENGRAWRLYDGYPELVMQTNKQNVWHEEGVWYNNIEYGKEREYGLEYREDNWVPGYFETSIRKGETVVLSIGLEAVNPKMLKSMLAKSMEVALVAEVAGAGLFSRMLGAAAWQFCREVEGRYFLVAGYPWFRCRARDQFIALPGVTLCLARQDWFEKIMGTAVEELRRYMCGGCCGSECMEEADQPDVMLWAVWAVQQYALEAGMREAVGRYCAFVLEIIDFIMHQRHPNLLLHSDGMLYVDGRDKVMTWMNAVRDGRPITPRSGYVVEVNALWYNTLQFGAEMLEYAGRDKEGGVMHYQAQMLKRAFMEKMWNGRYLYDYVDGDYSDPEVRPNQIVAVALPFTMLGRGEQKLVVDMVTKELLTVRGLRTISPKSGLYRPNYVGEDNERIRNMHDGPVWPWTTGVYVDAYLRVYRRSGVPFMQQLLSGFEGELSELTIGTLSELYDGNPPFKGHGAMSFAMTVGEILRAARVVSQYGGQQD